MTFFASVLQQQKAVSSCWFSEVFWVPDFFHQQAAACPATAPLTLIGLIKQPSLQVAPKLNPTMNVM